ncbi:unnamed protein product [Larinioides sclopetarius]|uniref:Monocarboxylate transporter n=1 Tax=Larinioides sclopetarius TaxID=280406 RepID=A0AAV2BNA1_9ARAC
MKSTGMNSRDSWLATMACTFMSFLIMMPAKLSGLLFVEILGRYQTDRAMASYPLLLCMLVRCSGGPLTGYCGEMFGLHAVIVVGSIFSALGVAVCFLAEDITTMIVFLGLVYGLGLTFSMTLFPQVLKQHFSKNLTLAISMSMFGSCFGGFVFPPIITWIFQSYGVSGTFLIMGGIVLNSLPFAMLLKYLKPKTRLAATGQKQGKNLLKKTDNPVATAATTNLTSKSAGIGRRKDIGDKEEYCVWELRDKSNNKFQDQPSRVVNGEKLAKHYTSLNNGCHSDLNHQNFQATLEQAVTLLPKPVESVHENNTEKKPSTEMKPVDKKSVSKQKAALQSLTIFLDFAFQIIHITQSLEVIIQVLTLTTMLDYSRDKGLDRSCEVYFLMSLPLAEVMGRVFLSMIIDRDYITKLNFTIISFIVLAAVILVIAWAKTFAVMLFGVVAFGLVTSGLLSVFPMLVFQFIEPKNYIMALASKSFFYGPLSFLCAPLIGHFRGDGGSYDWVYYMQAIMAVFCALLCLFTPHCAKRRDRKNEKRREKAMLNSSINA